MSTNKSVDFTELDFHEINEKLSKHFKHITEIII